MKKVMSSIPELPKVPAIYALMGGYGKRSYVAYVGMADVLRRRIEQHLVKRDSSISTGTAAVGLNPDYVRGIVWWEHVSFVERNRLEAAENIAYEILNPSLRSRGQMSEEAKQIYSDVSFRNEMRTLFSGQPAGCIAVPTLQEALRRIAALDKRVALLESKLMKD